MSFDRIVSRFIFEKTSSATKREEWSRNSHDPFGRSVVEYVSATGVPPIIYKSTLKDRVHLAEGRYLNNYVAS